MALPRCAGAAASPTSGCCVRGRDGCAKRSASRAPNMALRWMPPRLRFLPARRMSTSPSAPASGLPRRWISRGAMVCEARAFSASRSDGNEANPVTPSWPGLSRPSTSLRVKETKTWMPGTRPGMTSNNCTVPMSSFHARREEFVCADHPRRKSLLMDVAADRLEGGAVGLETIGPEIRAEYAPCLFDVIDQPRQRDAQRIGVVKAADREVARFHERPVDAARGPRMRAVDVLAQHHRMHDRQDARAVVIIPFDLLVVRKQPPDAR